MKQEQQKKIHKLLLDSALIDYSDNQEVDKFIAQLQQFDKLELLGVYTSSSIIENIIASNPIVLSNAQENGLEQGLEQTWVDNVERNNFTITPSQSTSHSFHSPQALYYLNIFGVLQKIKHENKLVSKPYQKGIDKCLNALNYNEDKDKIISLKNRYNSYSFNFNGAKKIFNNLEIEQLDKSVQNDWYLYKLGESYSLSKDDIKKLNMNMHIEHFNLEQAIKIIGLISTTSKSFHDKVENFYSFKKHFKNTFEKENSVVQFCKLFFKNVARYEMNSFTSSKAFKSEFVNIEGEVEPIYITYSKKFIDFLGVNLQDDSYHQLKNLLINTFPTNQILALSKENLFSIQWADLINKHHMIETSQLSGDSSKLFVLLDKNKPLFAYAQEHNMNKTQLFYSLISSPIKDEDLHLIIKNNLNYLSSSDFNFNVKDKEHSAYHLLKNDHFATFDELMRVGFDLTLVNRDGKNLMEQLKSKKKYQPFSIILEQFTLEQSISETQDTKRKIKI